MSRSTNSSEKFIHKLEHWDQSRDQSKGATLLVLQCPVDYKSVISFMISTQFTKTTGRVVHSFHCCFESKA